MRKISNQDPRLLREVEDLAVASEAENTAVKTAAHDAKSAEAVLRN